MKRYRWLGLGVVALATTLPVLAQEKRDNVSEGFRAFIVNEPRFATSEIRNRAGKMQDLVCDHGLNPVIAVFSRTIPADATHPLNAIIAKQDELANDYASRRLGTYAVFLSLKDEFRKDETRDARLAEIQRFIKEASPKRTTIGLADVGGLPVSTTHVLSSGVAGTMWANKSGIQPETVREIALAWILTLPVAMALSGGLYWLATLVTG